MYPVIYDSDGVVLSMPPIINGDKSKITLNTKNVLIECTGTDVQRTKVVLDTMVTMFSQYCEPEPFVIEAVEVVGGLEGQAVLYPELRTRTEVIEKTKVNKCCGIQADSKRVAELVGKMCFGAKALDGRRNDEFYIIRDATYSRTPILCYVFQPP